MAAAGALRRIVSKGLKEPADKLQLIRVLSLGQVMESLEERTRAEQIARGDDTDEGEESYRESLGRLLNVLGLELVKLADVSFSNFRMLDRLTLSEGCSCRRSAGRRHQVVTTSPPRHAQVYGGRIRRYLLDYIPNVADSPRQCIFQLPFLPIPH